MLVSELTVLPYYDFACVITPRLLSKTRIQCGNCIANDNPKTTLSIDLPVLISY